MFVVDRPATQKHTLISMSVAHAVSMGDDKPQAFCRCLIALGKWIFGRWKSQIHEISQTHTIHGFCFHVETDFRCALLSTACKMLSLAFVFYDARMSIIQSLVTHSHVFICSLRDSTSLHTQAIIIIYSLVQKSRLRSVAVHCETRSWWNYIGDWQYRLTEAEKISQTATQRLHQDTRGLLIYFVCLPLTQ